MERKIEKIFSDLKKTANKRKNSAFSTGSCVVGHDMDIGLDIANEEIRKIDLSSSSTEKQKCLEIMMLLEDLINDYKGPDSEGYVVGTIRDISNKISDMMNAI